MDDVHFSETVGTFFHEKESVLRTLAGISRGNDYILPIFIISTLMLLPQSYLIPHPQKTKKSLPSSRNTWSYAREKNTHRVACHNPRVPHCIHYFFRLYQLVSTETSSINGQRKDMQLFIGVRRSVPSPWERQWKIFPLSGK